MKIRLHRLALTAFALMAAGSNGEAAEKFVEMKSPAGIAFWYQARPDLQKASVIAGWRDGLGFALPGKEYLSSVAYQWLPRGAGERSGNELNEAMKDIGADGRIYGDGWRTYASLLAAPGNLALAAEISREIFSHPALDVKDLQRIGKNLANNIRQGDTLGAAVASRTATRYAFGDSVWTRLFEPGDAETITREDVVSWQKRVLARDNLVVAASGPLDAAAFGAIIDTAFGGLPEKSDVPPAPERWFKPAAKTIVVEMEQAQTVLMEMAATEISTDRERMKRALAVDVFGGGSGSRLFKKVRGQLGATYDIRAGLGGFVKHDVLGISGAFAHDKAVAAVAAIDEEYALWQEKGLSAEEFEAIRSSTKSSNEQASAKPGTDAQAFVSAMLAGRPPNDAADFAERLAGYTLEAVNSDIAATFPRAPLVKVIVTPDASLFKADCIIKTWREADKCR